MKGSKWLNMFFCFPIAAESISTDTIRNCMKVLEKLGAIEITNTTGVRCVSLQEKYDAYDSLQCIVQRFESIVTV